MVHRTLHTVSVLLFVTAFFLIGDKADTGSAWSSAWALVVAGLAAFAASQHWWRHDD